MNMGTMLPDLVAEETRFGLGWNSTFLSVLIDSTNPHTAG